jgi:hypothetical protein
MLQSESCIGGGLKYCFAHTTVVERMAPVVARNRFKKYIHDFLKDDTIYTIEKALDGSQSICGG